MAKNSSALTKHTAFIHIHQYTHLDLEGSHPMDDTCSEEFHTTKSSLVTPRTGCHTLMSCYVLGSFKDLRQVSH